MGPSDDRRDREAGDALGAERALADSVREAAENEGRAERESRLEHLTEATHGVRSEEDGHSPPPPPADARER
jgi:hypothetical protein